MSQLGEEGIDTNMIDSGFRPGITDEEIMQGKQGGKEKVARVKQQINSALEGGQLEHPWLLSFRSETGEHKHIIGGGDTRYTMLMRAWEQGQITPDEIKLLHVDMRPNLTAEKILQSERPF